MIFRPGAALASRDFQKASLTTATSRGSSSRKSRPARGSDAKHAEQAALRGDAANALGTGGVLKVAGHSGVADQRIEGRALVAPVFQVGISDGPQPLGLKVS
jgi:hypothetical protein